MNSKGKVLKVNGTDVEILVLRQGACGENCAACNSCSNKSVNVVAYCEFDVRPGDFVTISSDSIYVYLGLFMVFLLPVIFPIVTYIALMNINSLFSVIFSVIAFILSLLFVFYVSKNKRFLSKLKPVVTSVINKY